MFSTRFSINNKINLILNKLLLQNKKMVLSSIAIADKRLFHDEFSNKVPLNDEQKKLKNDLSNMPIGLKSKYQVFRDVDSVPIFDVEEERRRALENLETEDIAPEHDRFEGINLKRGENGVFEINDLVDVLRHENGEDIFVCSVPEEYKYVNFMCIVTGRSYRHMNAMAEFVRRVYKMKRNQTDAIPKIEGQTSQDWMAMDLGNIALHIFSEKSRTVYDLESLWAIGAKYDKECNKPNDPLAELFTEHSMYLDDLKPKT